MEYYACYTEHSQLDTMLRTPARPNTPPRPPTQYWPPMGFNHPKARQPTILNNAFQLTRYNDTKNTNIRPQWRIHPCQHNNHFFPAQGPARNHCETSSGQESPALSRHDQQKGSRKALLAMPCFQWLSPPARYPPAKIPVPFLS